ncbi:MULTISPECIES: hypothetical protein [Agrobacterium]|uniref:Uncharacterized protein n=1 Tax=Agrobacterium tumefaciens TaxID=358 RepID=A0AAF0GZH5_AGRTU|nr:MULTISPECIES: hypothetical protein [Agrobacterium]WGM60974.1 hypothetical protein CFBP5506_14915 [Agrobacterium tumefaciens]
MGGLLAICLNGEDNCAPPRLPFQSLPKKSFLSHPHHRILAASFLPQPERKGDTRGAFREPEAGIDKHGSGKPCF